MGASPKAPPLPSSGPAGPLEPFGDGRGRMVSAEAGLLEAIRENPGDDALRLIYADWLEENDDGRGRAERARLIRAQVELAELPPFARRCEELRSEVQGILQEYGEEWMEGLPRPAGLNWSWERGFPWAI